MPLKQRSSHYPTWGSRKIAQRMHDLGIDAVPTASTVPRILHRHDLISERASERSKFWQRFEHTEPNDLWQIDFKGHVETGSDLSSIDRP